MSSGGGDREGAGRMEVDVRRMMPMSSGISGGGGGGLAWRETPFTAMQWEELQLQAMVYKFFMAGVTVPPELVLHIRRSYDTLLSSRLYGYKQPVVAYDYHGMKLDSEPGRCRRTDGKKWRCAKEAAPGSKYCERHMNRGRNRSRKPVETQPPVSQIHTTDSMTTSGVLPKSPAIGSGGGGNFKNSSLLRGNSNNSSMVKPLTLGNSSTFSQLQVDTCVYEAANKDFSYPFGASSLSDEYSIFSENSGNDRGLGNDYSLDSSWGLIPSRGSSFPVSAYPLCGSSRDIGESTIGNQQQHAFFPDELGAVSSVKPEAQLLRPFFDVWPKTASSWQVLPEESSYITSIPAARGSSDVSPRSSRSPNETSL